MSKTLKKTVRKKTVSKNNLHKHDGKLLTMTYDISISGKKLPFEKKQCITSISIVETVEGSDSATIKISDPDFVFVDDNIFIEDNTVDIKLGWVGSTYRVHFSGYISTIDITFEQTGIPSLTITCMDKTYKMNRKKRSKTYKNTTSASVVKQLVKKYGFKCVVDSSYKFTKQESISQSNQTDIDFITKLASDEVHPFTARLVGNTFYFVKMGKLTTPSLELTYRKYPHDIISFSPKINKESKQKQTSKSTVSSKKKKTSTTTSTKGKTTKKTTTTSKAITNSSKKKSSGGSKSSGSYTYDPKKTRTWTHNK